VQQADATKSQNPPPPRLHNRIDVDRSRTQPLNKGKQFLTSTSVVGDVDISLLSSSSLSLSIVAYVVKGAAPGCVI
jgi:hypothetical protein